MYLLLITLGFCVVYGFLYLLFPLFFVDKLVPFRRRIFASLFYIIGFYFLISFISINISDVNWANRFLHIFGGGFLSFAVCFLVVKDTKLHIGKFRFFTFSFLIVLSLGVANEILEYVLQNFTELSFATTASDTWLDLASNCIGALLAGMFFVPFIKTLKGSVD